MRKSHIITLSIVVFCCITLFSTSCSSYGIKYKTSGTFVDSTGGQHFWSINDAHTLMWDSDPYVPVGGVFVSRYLSPGATENDYQKDLQDLETLKSKGITDVILSADGPITSTEPANLQRIVDFLDANGFSYGIEMNDGPKESLSGYLISPNRYRLEGPSDKRSIVCQWPDVDSAIYLVINQFDNTIKERGGAVVKEGKVTISLQESLRSGQLLIVYPHKTFKSSADGGMSDLWSGFGEYRDRLIAFLSKVEFGVGLRFFLEPFTSKMDFTGEMISFLPDSSGFRLGLEAYLARKYQHSGGVNSAWGMNENVEDIETAARLIPLWASGRGMPYAYDRASAGLYSIDATMTQMWRDVVDYRDSSAQEYMNTISDVIRKQCANVPVVFIGAKYHRIFANPFGTGGYDGIGVQGYGKGTEPVANAAGPLYSLAEESGKTTWFFVAHAQMAADSTTAYSSQSSMLGTLEMFLEIGCKGFFVDELYADTRQIEWLKNFKDKLRSKGLTEFKPEVVCYPISINTGAYVKRLLPNTWWLPTLKTGKTSYVGDGFSAYTIAGEDRTYIWSNVGERTVTIKSPPTGMPRVDFPPDGRVSEKRGGTFSVTLNDVPTALKGIDISLAFPSETAQTQINRLANLIPEADRAGINVQTPRDNLDRAKNLMKHGQYMQAWDMSRTSVMDLLLVLGTDVWTEGEQSRKENFDDIEPVPGASNALALVLDTDEDPPLMPYCASFDIDAAGQSSYEIWIAGTLPSDGSPMSYTIDDINWERITPVEVGETYAQGLSWYKIGSANLYPGKHVLRMRADGRRSKDNRYYFAVDAVVLSPKGFKPNGVIKPF